MEDNIYVPDESEKGVINNYFQTLKKALENTELETESGKKRKVHPGEFMLMCIDGQRRVHFKHSHTKNHLFLNLDGTITVPLGEPFYRGFFDEMEGP